MNFQAHCMDKSGNSTQTEKCGNCGATVNLMKCTKCSTAVYCSKTCQIANWPEHKMVCKILKEMKSKASKVKSKADQFDAIGSMYKMAEKQGMPAARLLITHAGNILSDDKEMPAGVPENFPFIHEAATKMAMLGGEKRMYGEREYKRLYDDLVANEQEWMEVSVPSFRLLMIYVYGTSDTCINNYFVVQFFEHFLNNGHTGDCAMVLELLTGIYYERGDYESCGQVLDMHAKVLHYCKKHVVRVGEDGFTQFCLWSEYRTKQTMYEMNLILNHHLSRNIPLFKELCQFELTYKPAKDQILCKRWKKMFRKCRSLDDLSDAMILELIKVHSLEVGAVKVDSARVRLHECGLCKKKETSLGEFMNCSRCKKVAYCGRECQKQHWKTHKSNCKAAPRGK